MTRGFTLLELTVALFLSALVLVVTLPAARAVLDRMAVVGAREELVGSLARARSLAVGHGGAHLTIGTDGVVRVEASGVVHHRVDLPGRFDVEVEIGGGSAEASLLFDALGIGRAASRTVVLRRREETSSVVVSSYGRVSRR